MNIGLDLDGTINAAPWLFSVISHALQRRGHNVYVITFRDRKSLEATEAELELWEIGYDQLFLPEAGDRSSMWDWKAKIAKELKLDVMIDDSPEVLTAMPPQVVKILMA